MGLETGTGIGDLVPANPLSTDAVSAGDDHIRLIKTVMQSITFLKSIQTFATAGANTWTRPTNVRKILIYCLGGGSGGGGSPGTANSYSGAGGASGAAAIKWLDVTAIASATVTIGAGGAGGAAGANAGSNGGFTAFTTSGPVNQCVAREGLAGPDYSSAGIPSARGLSIGDIIFTGAYGHGGAPVTATGTFGSNGGGAGGASDKIAFANSGGGGGGAFAISGSTFAGGAGGSGYCIVFEFGW